jgi:hypothetical protein
MPETRASKESPCVALRKEAETEEREKDEKEGKKKKKAVTQPVNPKASATAKKDGELGAPPQEEVRSTEADTPKVHAHTHTHTHTAHAHIFHVIPSSHRELLKKLLSTRKGPKYLGKQVSQFPGGKGFHLQPVPAQTEPHSLRTAVNCEVRTCEVRTCELTISGRYQAVRFSLSWDRLQTKALTSWKLGHLLSEILWTLSGR